MLTQAAETVDETHLSETRAASEYHYVSRYVHDLATDTATIDGYNTSAHQVCYLRLWQ